MVTGSVKRGWYEDPSDRHEYRWFSQGAPTDLVKDGTVTSRDPISITDPAAFESMELARPPAPPRHDVPRWVPRPRQLPPPMGKWAWRAFVAVLAAWGLGSVYYILTSPSGVPSGSASYLMAGRANLIFILWHRPSSSGDITGMITFASLAGKPPSETVRVQSHHFTGHLSRAQLRTAPSISLTIDDLSLSESLTGTFQDGRLALWVPGPSGFGGSTSVLVRSDPAGYRAAIQLLTADSRRADKAAAARPR